MTPSASAGHVGHVHEAGFYTSDDEFRALILPFVEAGVDAAQPVILGYDQRKSDLLRGWVQDPSITYITDPSLYATPAGAIANYRRIAEVHVAAGATAIRIAGDVPHAGNGGRFEGWDRYESAVNTVWNDLPMRSACLYHATTVSPQVRDVVERTHPHFLTLTGERLVNDRYEDPQLFAGLDPEADPLEATTPIVDLDGATPAQARRAITEAAHSRLDEATLADVELGGYEAAVNAHVHGKAPTRLRIWGAPDRVVVHVQDSGRGPIDRLAGLVRATYSSTGGLGLWLTHQLDIDVDLIVAPDNFTVRLRATRTPLG
jgi:anti-sigma regulatory factor (Ser/Thr protein kinase)